MSSSSSDSDSDDFEPIRRIKINIRPKEEVAKRDGADVNEIKASVEAWRPLGPPPHPSLTRRQSSMSSVSSLSFGVGSNYGGSSGATSASLAGSNQFQGNTRGNMRSSPSCSSLVNEFNNRSSFSNFMSTTSRTSSPLTLMSNYGDAVPIAIAIQESIELTVKGQRGPSIGETKFDTRALGNIKVAFPNAFAQKCAITANNGFEPTNNSPILKLRMHSTENIIRYYASRLIKDLDLGTKNQQNNPTDITDAFTPTPTPPTGPIVDHKNGTGPSKQIDNNVANQMDQFTDLFDLQESPVKGNLNSRVIEFDMQALSSHLKEMYEKSPNLRYYNVDVLRYQIEPPREYEQCPLQVCAYWKCEPKLTKLRIDFKHSNKCGLNLERLRDIRFCIDLAKFIPAGLDVNSLSPDSLSSVRLNNNNNDSIAMNMNASTTKTTMTNSFHSPTTIICNNNNNGSNNNPINQSIQAPTTLITHQAPNPQPIGSYIIDNEVGIRQQTNNVVQQSNYRATTSKLSTANSTMQIKLPPPPSASQVRGYNSTLTRTTAPLKTGGFSAFTPTQHSNFRLSQQSYTSLFNQQQPTQSSSFGDNISTTSSSSSSSSARPTQRSSLVFGGNPQQQQQQQQQNTHQLIDTDSLSCNTTASDVRDVTLPYLTFEPQGHWNKETKQLTWKFDNLLSYYKTDGYGSLLAKLDFRNYHGMLPMFMGQLADPCAVDVKFMIVDSTLSKVNMSIDTTGYRISLLKKEIRSGRYKSEPYVF